MVFSWSKANPSPLPDNSMSTHHLEDHTYCRVGQPVLTVSEPGPSATQSEDMPLEEQPVDHRQSGSVICTPSTLYSVAGLTDDVLRMETGLPNMEMFKRVAGLVERFQGPV